VAKVISIHSFRGGTGKSNTTANMAAVLARQGQRVGIIDTDIQSPGIHILFGLHGDQLAASLNDYLWHESAIKDVALDVTPSDGGEPIPGKIFLIPSSTKPGEISRVLREGYDAQRLTRGLRELLTTLNLDTLIIDTHPGLNQETLLSLVISHALVIVMRPDQQDYEGTGITVQVAKELQVPRIYLLVNKSPAILEPEAIRVRVEEAYGVPVAGVFPHVDEMMNLASSGLFVLRYPNHPLSTLFHEAVAIIMA
jgi:septum site-determining protein MinD